jgi:hypothetical protein
LLWTPTITAKNEGADEGLATGLREGGKGKDQVAPGIGQNFLYFYPLAKFAKDEGRP